MGEREIKMIDITEKSVVYRYARASGKIKLKHSTIEAIVENRIKKGDVISATKIVAIQSVKKTPDLLPLCHPIPITGVNVEVNPNVNESYVEVIVEVKSVGKTGVEMEALTGVMAGLLNIWDMTKYLEKDENGQYPETRIFDIRVEKKVKEGYYG